MTTTLAWYNNPALKAEVSARMLQHRVEDSIIQGAYQTFAPEYASQYKGCLIGCTLPMAEVRAGKRCGCGCGEWIEPSIVRIDWHEQVEKLYGIPQTLNHVFDALFESLPPSRAAWFAVNTIEAIPVGADLSGVAELLAQDIQEMAKRGRKSFWMAASDEGVEWLSWWVNDYLDQYERSTSRQKAVILAEKLLDHLTNAPVPSVVNREAADRLLDDILNEVITTAEETTV